MIVVETSAWIELLRGTRSAVHLRLRQLISEEATLAVTGIVVAEVLAGARPDEVGKTRERLLSFPVLPLRGVADFEAAAALYRACREAGEAVRHLTDCLVAVPAITARATILHANRDFEKLARHTPLRLEPV